MALKRSTGLRNAMLDSGSFKSTMDTCTMKIYSGVEPSSADDALSGNILLCEIKSNAGASALTFAATASDGEITKTLAEVWQGNVIVGGTATFYRLELSTDDQALSIIHPRVQGSVGLTEQLHLSDPVLVLSAVQPISYFSLGIPE